MSKVYIYVLNRKTPSKTVKGKWDTFEEVYIKSKIIPKLHDSSSFVLEIMNQKLDKNRYQFNDENKTYTFENVISYLSKNHKSVRELMDSYKEVMDAYNTAIKDVEATLTAQDKLDTDNGVNVEEESLQS